MSPKQPHTELQEELRNGDYQPASVDAVGLRREIALDLADALMYPGRIDLTDVVMRHVAPALAARDRRIADLEEALAAISSPARRAAAHAAILNLLHRHHPDADNTTTHGGTGEPRALADDAAAYTNAAINALVGGA